MNISQAFHQIAVLGAPIANSVGKNFGIAQNSTLYNQISLGIGIFLLCVYIAGLTMAIYTILGYFTYHFKIKENEDNAQFKRKKNHFLIWGIVSAAGLLILPSLVLLICGLTSQFAFHPEIISS